ncbi:HpcH/HpaI aldolase/citrate lyase family protein [Piscinibacter koreensis]|uniref:CoA ester lyase n=1 Tax=Piscinibacter koreensis TaxID=2742824 RepID=A0A7Y6NQP0_9BURK|nr:CoA ester lyase [Schlegelella koreensis]NUZ07568.1 CoA ester lyase [Schlegelella koreensis]
MTAPAAAPRAYLFVPADRPERFAKARASGADAVIVDLEDAVAPDVKPRARDALATALDEAAPLIVRVNAAGTPWFDDDLELCRHPGVAAVMLPKADGIDAVCHAFETSFKDVLPIIESARGIEEARAIARVPGVTRLAFGSIDLAVDLGIDCAPDGAEAELQPYRAQVVLASRLGGLAAPADGVSIALDDTARLQADAERARRMGFGAKLCIHPRQIAVVQAAFTPEPARVAWAQRVCAAFAASGGAAVAVDGQMIDVPVVERARAVLRSAGLAG